MSTQTPNLPGNLRTSDIIAVHNEYQARKRAKAAARKAQARKLAAAARKSERQAQADAIAMSECLTVGNR